MVREQGDREVTELGYEFYVLMDAQVCEYTKKPLNFSQFKWVNSMVYELCLDKAVRKTQGWEKSCG